MKKETSFRKVIFGHLCCTLLKLEIHLMFQHIRNLIYLFVQTKLHGFADVSHKNIHSLNFLDLKMLVIDVPGVR